MITTRRQRACGLVRQADGQILVIFVGSLFLLIAIAAVVIDLGFVFMLRRQEQDAADPGAIAAARFIRTGATPDRAGMRRAACFYAHRNGFFSLDPGDSTCASTSDPDGAVLDVNYPPSAAGGTYAGREGFVEVTITRDHRSFFAGFFGMARIGVSSTAVGAFSAGDSNTSSLIALDPSTCGAGHIHGTGGVTIHPVVAGTSGGYVHVDSACASSGADDVCTNGSGGLKVDGGGVLTAPHTYVVGSCQATAGDVNSTVTEGAVTIGDPLGELSPPRLSDYPAGKCDPAGAALTPGAGGCKFNSAGTINLSPGVYYGGWSINNNVTLVLAPGMYIIAGGGIKLNAGGSITSVQGGTGAPAPVMFFNTDDPSTHSGQSSIDFTAQSTLSLRPIASGPYRGILAWNDRSGSNPTAQITLGGQTVLDIGGTIYSAKGLVKVEGGSGVGSSNLAAIQIIAWQFDVGGNAHVDMPYDPSGLYRLDQKGLVR